MSQNSSFFIVGRHAVLEALKNSKRRVNKIFLTEDSKKNIHKHSPDKNLLKRTTIDFVNNTLSKNNTSLYPSTPA